MEVDSSIGLRCSAGDRRRPRGALDHSTCSSREWAVEASSPDLGTRHGEEQQPTKAHEGVPSNCAALTFPAARSRLE